MRLTEDHKPNAPAESARIVAAGGHVTTPYARGTENVPRLNGAFSVSRALGDAPFKLNAEVSVRVRVRVRVRDTVRSLTLSLILTLTLTRAARRSRPSQTSRC